MKDYSIKNGQQKPSYTFNQLEINKTSKYMNVKKVSTASIIIIVFVLLFISVIQAQPSSSTPQLPNNSCADCHRRLLFSTGEQRQFIEIRIKHLESGISCSIVCHEDKLNKSTPSDYALWSVSIHSLYNITCEKCHGGNQLAITESEAHVGLSNDSISRINTPETCGKCHQAELEEFKSSKHFKHLESNETAPACITCHQAHSVHVLAASEIEDFCGNCHNNITGINPSVPKRAAEALSSVNELQIEISKARTAITSAQAEGKDVNDAEAYLASSKAILKNIPSVWHRFNLTYFGTEVQQGIINAKKAENASSGGTIKPTVPKSPGFEGIMLIIGLLAVYFMKRLGD